MKTLYRVLFCALLLQGSYSLAWADDGQIEGCGDDSNCDTCINNALLEVGKTVPDLDSDSGEQSPSGVESQ